MRPLKQAQVKSHKAYTNRKWLFAVSCALLMFACLSLALINVEPGFYVNGNRYHYWLESDLNNYRRCPAHNFICDSQTFDGNIHFYLWLLWNTQELGGTKIMRYRTLIDIPFPPPPWLLP